MAVDHKRLIEENQRWNAFIQEIMHVFHVDQSEATATALSMIIRECILAAHVAEAIV